MAKTYQVELDENEIKLLLVAIRQVINTFTIAEAQSTAAGEPLDAQYGTLQDLYDRLHGRLAALVVPSSQENPFRIR